MNSVKILTFLIFFVMAFAANATELRKNERITADTVWSGIMVIEGPVTVERGAVLTIAPGTTVKFKKKDTDADGVSETQIMIYGGIKAQGTPQKPILFTSGEEKKDWGDWKEIQINHAKDVAFEYCIFEYAEYSLHIHFSEGVLRNNIFRYNNDATRLGNSKLKLTNNLFEKNKGKAINFTNCQIQIESNTVRFNREGLFVFERPGEVMFQKNNIYENTVNIKTGDFFSGVLKLGENYLDKQLVGADMISIQYASAPFMEALPLSRNAYVIYSADTGGFVDGEGSFNGDDIVFPCFDGNLYHVNWSTRTVRKYPTVDFTDAAPLIDNNSIYYINWGGSVGAIDMATGQNIWKTEWPRTLKDDHRMASPIIIKDKIFIMSQGGTLSVFNTSNGRLLHQQTVSGEFRATPLRMDNSLVFPSTDGNIIFFGMEDHSLRQKKLPGRFYSSPVLHAGQIVLLSKDGKLFYLNEKLDLVTQKSLPGTYRYQSPVLVDNVLVAFSLEGDIVTLNKERMQSKKVKEIFTATPLNYNGYLVVPCFSGKLMFYKHDKHFFIDGFGEIQFKPLMIKDAILFGTRDNKIYAVKPW